MVSIRLTKWLQLTNHFRRCEEGKVDPSKSYDELKCKWNKQGLVCPETQSLLEVAPAGETGGRNLQNEECE